MADAAGLFARGQALYRRGGGVNVPPGVLLSWPTPNTVNPEERGWESSIILMVAMGVTFLVFIGRMWARLVVAKNAGLDDILMSVAMLPVFGLTISAILAIRVYGFQWHAWDQSQASQITSREITMAIELNYLVSTTLIKVSILYFYRRITGTLKDAFVFSTWGMMAFCIIASIIFVFLIIFTCAPVIGSFHLFDLSWRIKNEVTCLDEGAIIVACAIVGTIQDFFVCMLPILLVWNLKMSKRQKVALCGIFAVGLLTCICGILRTYYATYVYYFTYDITWYAYYGWIWTALEADLGVICASAPAMKVFFKRYFSLSIASGTYSRSGTGRSPFPTSRSRGKGSLSKDSFSGHSAIASRADTNGRHDSIPLSGIKVSQNLDVHVEERDDISQKSFASTRNLTALPSPGDNGTNDWRQSARIAWAGMKPSSRNGSRTYAEERDIEFGPTTA